MAAASVRTISVVIPVKDGARYLSEVLEALAGQEIDASVEVLVIDSGSTDGSLEIARSADVRLIEIPPSQFGHGRTRNLAIERASGECIAFLTQDATPATSDWLANLVAPLDGDERIGLSFGPHLPRPSTSPMVARELDEFFGGFSAGGAVRIDRRIDLAAPATGFFSNVNSCTLRECWREVRFRDVGYAEDQAFARDAIAAGWQKAYVPAAGVLHAHDYPFVQFMRRYFDEYRGLRETVGHVAPRSPGAMSKAVLGGVRGDLAYMRRMGAGRSKRLAGGLRSARHHAGRALFSALGSRAHRIPTPVQSRLSLEGQTEMTATEGGPRTRRIKPRAAYLYAEVGVCARNGLAPLTTARPARKPDSLIEIAWLIPPFGKGSGGHMTIFTLISELEQLGHRNSIWIHDPGRVMARRAKTARGEIAEDFVPLEAEVSYSLERWRGAQVAIATGWQTAYPLAQLEGCELRAYLVQDFEPDFYATSAERMWAEETYRMGFPCIAASPWLRDRLRERYGATAESFELGVDLDIYRPLGVQRDPATIVYYARPVTPRRGTEIGLLALDEVVRRQPGARVVLFGDEKAQAAPFEYEFAGIVPPAELAQLYNRATVGLVISLTNYSRMPKEMMACGLPVVDVNHPSVLSVFGSSSDVIELADPNLTSIADHVCKLLNDPEHRMRIANAAERFVSGMTWNRAATEIEHHLRRWLSEQRPQALAAGADAVRS